MSLGSYLKNNRPRSIVLTVVFVLACLVFIVGVVCVISITQMLGSPDLPDADTAVNQSSVSNSESTVSSFKLHFKAKSTFSRHIKSPTFIDSTLYICTVY